MASASPARHPHTVLNWADRQKNEESLASTREISGEVAEEKAVGMHKVFPDYRRSWAAMVLQGEFDRSTVADLRQEVRLLLDDYGPMLIMDVSRLDSLDSGGVDTLTGLTQELRAKGGRLALAGARGHVLHALHASRLTSIIPLYLSVADAVISLDRGETTGASEGVPDG
ncbi:hypothetical protein GCM10022419_087020 [Nonomuraea rosea]|uniref:STAS domain-containing protein n=2 Tax=Nonomuraea rosea TaxID=638574 RepID=A0ABP6YU72_9ACTN